jgi:hypothetical protein
MAAFFPPAINHSGESRKPGGEWMPDQEFGMTGRFMGDPQAYG